MSKHYPDHKHYPDQWIQLKPAAGSGSGRKRLPPAAKLSGGQLVLNHAASELLGNPDRVLVRINPGQVAIRLSPTTPNDAGGFALSGGGNAQCRISLREVAGKWPELAGEYHVSRATSGVLLTKVEG